MVLQVAVEEADLEDVADAVQHLHLVEGFGQEILGAAFEGFQAGRLGHVRGEDQDGEVVPSVRAVRRLPSPRNRPVTACGGPGGGCRAERHGRGPGLGADRWWRGNWRDRRLEDFLQQEDVGFLVVRDQDPGVLDSLQIDHDVSSGGQFRNMSMVLRNSGISRGLVR